MLTDISVSHTFYRITKSLSKSYF